MPQLVIVGQSLVLPIVDMTYGEHVLSRHKTAMSRVGVSRPISLALEHGIITAASTVLDYGCGKGRDVYELQARGILATGWDPFFRPDEKLCPAEVVNLGYVLNVIEKPAERIEVLKKAFSLAAKVLVVSVRTERALFASAEVFADGFLTGRGTFQKLYAHDEFRNFIESTLGVKPFVASYGVAFLFKDPEFEASFLANHAFKPRVSANFHLLERLRANPAIEEAARIVEELGRLPTETEWPALNELKQDAGSKGRLLSLIREKLDHKLYEANRERKRLEIGASLLSLYLPKRRFPKVEELPGDIRLDIESLWSSYRKATAMASEFLFELGKPGTVERACKSSKVGKHLPESLYVHRSAVSSIPAHLRVLISCSELIVGAIPYDLVKFKHHGRSLSFLFYENFDEDPHPPLGLSIKVDLSQGMNFVRDYRQSENRPILHRKELFVDADYPMRELFANLTSQEEASGVLDEKNIGYQKQWLDLLKARNLVTDGHELRSLS